MGDGKALEVRHDTTMTNATKGVPAKHLFVLKLSKPYMSKTPIRNFELGSWPNEAFILFTSLVIKRKIKKRLNQLQNYKKVYITLFYNSFKINKIVYPAILEDTFAPCLNDKHLTKSTNIHSLPISLKNMPK